MDGKSWLRAEWDRVAGYTLIALGALLLVLGYAGVSGSPYVAEGLSYIMSGGIGGLFMLGAGATLLISADLHDEWRKLDRIESALRGQALPDPAVLLDLLQPRPAGGPSPAGNGDGGGAVREPLVSHGPVTTGGALAVALDWAGDRFRRGLALAAAALLLPAALLGTGWQVARDTGNFQVAVRGVGIGILAVCLTLLVIGVYTLWLRARVAGRQAQLFGACLLAGRTGREGTGG
jgi:hypothetical protein